MGRLIDYFVDNATDLMFNFAGFLVVYMIARLLKASPIVATSFGVLPLLVAYYVQHPDSPTRLFAMLG